MKTHRTWYRRLGLGFMAAAVSGFLAAAPAAAETVDLELVLAVDASASVSEQEFALQMRGIADALRDPATQAAIASIGPDGVAISLVQWADSHRQLMSVDWHRLSEPESVLAFADTVEAAPRLLVGGGTAIWGAIRFGLRQFERNQYEGRRQVIDISGDGRTNQGPQDYLFRDQAVERGVTVNGLAILNEDPMVDGYYLEHVVGGNGAFVMTATTFDDFYTAMLKKLLREIGSPPIVERAPDPRLDQALQVAAMPPPQVANPRFPDGMGVVSGLGTEGDQVSPAIQR